jgi:hypothetical protein
MPQLVRDDFAWFINGSTKRQKAPVRCVKKSQRPLCLGLREILFPRVA